MLPSAYPYNRQILQVAWKEFTTWGKVYSVPIATLDPAVIRSWHRCRKANLDPYAPPILERLDEAAIEQRRQACFDLIAVARPFIEDIYQFAGESNLLLYLTDADLYVLESLGDVQLENKLCDLDFSIGMRMEEKLLSTNAACLALTTSLPAQVVGAEHYCAVMHDLCGTAAPIHAPSGELMGVIGIVVPESYSHPHTVSVVMAATRAIENQLQAELSLQEAHRHLDELNTILHTMRRGVIFLDLSLKITHINPSAGELLEIPHRMAMGRKLNNLITLPAEVEIALAQRSQLTDQEIIFATSYGPQSCIVSLRPLLSGPRQIGFILTIERAADVHRLAQRVTGARAHFTFDDILGNDLEMRRVLHYARMIAMSDSTVLLLGESGTGKEMFAHAIHNSSRRANGPFIAINCAAIPRELMSSELFGYEGAFAPHSEGRPGKFELANGGTIFLDNVDGMPLDMQASLLRILDTQEVMRMGSNQAIPLDVRVIAASNNIHLMDEVQRGRFRADLFYRLRVFTLTIPPLRERGNDILLLVANLLEKFNRQLKKSITISPEAMAVLQSYHWPGNVRELENVLEQAIHLVNGEKAQLTLAHLPAEVRTATIGSDTETILTIEEAERQAIIRAGRVLQGNNTQMAKALGISRTTLWRKMKAFNLSPDSFTN
ncbi:MAG TPA: PAS domain-containing protein [Chloroflexi bacterium]|nr:PAS domain-containing protein [Chloroflexota bacterium]